MPGIHSKNLVAILHLLVTLARYYRAPIRLPENVIINVIVVQVSSEESFQYSLYANVLKVVMCVIPLSTQESCGTGNTEGFMFLSL